MGAGGPSDADRQRRPRRDSTAPRSELSRHPRFVEISPEVGELDEDALAEAVADDPDDALALLMRMRRATDVELRRRVGALVPRLILDRARVGARSGSGAARLQAVRATVGGDIDIDASIEPITDARAQNRARSRIRRAASKRTGR